MPVPGMLMSYAVDFGIPVMLVIFRNGILPVTLAPNALPRLVGDHS